MLPSGRKMTSNISPAMSPASFGGHRQLDTLVKSASNNYETKLALIIQSKCCLQMFIFYCVSTRLDLDACKIFNFRKHDYKKNVYKLAVIKTLKLTYPCYLLTSLIRNYSVCQKHFKNNCFQKKMSPFRNKLNHNAVPENISNGGKFITRPRYTL